MQSVKKPSCSFSQSSFQFLWCETIQIIATPPPPQLLDEMSVHGTCKLNPAFCLTSRTVHKYPFILLGPVVWRWNFSLGFSIPLFKILFGVIFCNNHIPDKKNSTEFSFKVFRSEIRIHTNPGLSWPSFVQCYTGWSKAQWVRVKHVALISPYLKMINKVHF